MDIAKIRQDTRGCGQIIHLNNAGASLMPSVVADAIKNYITAEEFTGGYETADQQRVVLDSFYNHTATMLQCESRNIAFTTNATDSYNRSLSSIHFNPGDVILTTGNDYPSNFISFISLQKRYGVKIVILNNTPSGETDLDDLQKKLKAYHPRVLSVSHIPTSSGLVQPINEIGAIVDGYDTLFLLDACQSLGQLPVDATACKADFISGTFRKFLRGPRGAGLLYVSDKALANGLEPLFPDLQGATWTSVNEYIPRQDARRFEDWETAYALMSGSTEAVKYLLGIGIDEISERNKYLSTLLRQKLQETGFVKLQDKGLHPSAIITFSIDHSSPEEIKQYFRERGINIYTTSRSSAIMDFDEKGVEWVVRVSPHYYNTEEEIEHFISILTSMITKQ